jgi:hypothetical protein
MVTRKGSLKPIDVPIDILDRLNSGTIKTVNLAESLAIDFAILMTQVVAKHQPMRLPNGWRRRGSC